MLALITMSIFGSVALLAGALLYPLLSKGDSVKERVAKLMPQQEEEFTLVRTPKRWQSILARMGSRLQTKPTEMRIYREAVTAAGFKREAVYVLLGAKLLLAAALPASYLVLFALPQGKLAGSGALLMAVICAVAGYLLPTILLDYLARQRKIEVFHALPDVLDLLTVSVEAGVSLDAAMIRTIENYQDKKCPLISELNTVILEIRAGRLRSEALKGLAERTMVDDIKSLVSMLIQTEKFGTSLGKSLRIHADSLRIKRRQLAEEQAAKTAVKMLFPLTFCVFPALLVVMLVPAMFQILSAFK